MTIRTIFFDSTGRLRSGWRFAIFIILLAITATLIGGVGILVLRSLSVSLEPESANYIVANSMLLLGPVIFIGWLCGKYLEGLPFRALGASFTRGWLRNLAIGCAIGAATVSLAVAIAFVFGGLRFEANSVDTSSIIRSLNVSFLIFAAGAAVEEALFRGYILQTFARSGLAAMAIALTAIFFGAVHLANPGAGAVSTINTVLAGVWFGAAYLKTRDLWFVWGLHLMWNWVQGAFFGIEVSGLTRLVSTPLLREIDSGPAWLTGESYGVEGGIVATIALLVSTAAIYFMPGLEPSEEMVALTSPPKRLES